ncbi:MAG: BREX-2 system adenine-specific DNA-methyltransferase PglX [Sandaracinus sp.]|nr:BREX-2 system adenine-specific DNA-methyltransferase PglX [Sandaracinus sp.]
MAARKKSQKLAELASEPNPAAPIDAARFLAAAKPVLKALEADLLARARESAAVTEALKVRHAEQKKAERTAEAFAPWQRQLVEQVAAAWLLTCVFARALEDRGLLERNRIAGPGATDAQKLFFELAPSLTERDYLDAVFRELSHHPAAADLFGPKHNPVWLLAPSAEGAKALLSLFRSPSADAPAFRFGVASTRYLGDLYQDLNENVRERFALLQTPDFVEEFILDRTLDPAIEKFGLDDTELIDPTCGSGHFLLGAFDRFFDRFQRAQPDRPAALLAKAALDKVHGADLNPYAVAIAKFRLTLAFLDKAGIDKLRAAPALDLKLAVADSLLYNPQLEQGSLFHQEGADAAKWERRAFSLEDEDAARAVLHKQYAAVVGNPPYITVKDKALREQYRKLYPSAAGKYSLSVPFCERFFQLAKKGGRVGQITANSFMKREFGKKLIEDYLPSVNLDLIVNTSGAYIPGHGTPTVLLFGSHEAAQGNDVLAVLAKRGEPRTPDDPAKGLVWTSIVEHVEEVGYDDDYVTVARVERGGLAKHPWSLAGGGAGELKELLESRAERTLVDAVAAIGIMALTGEDEVYIAQDWQHFRRHHVSREMVRGLGRMVRDWSASYCRSVLSAYDDEAQHVCLSMIRSWLSSCGRIGPRSRTARFSAARRRTSEACRGSSVGRGPRGRCDFSPASPSPSSRRTTTSSSTAAARSSSSRRRSSSSRRRPPKKTTWPCSPTSTAPPPASG